MNKLVWIILSLVLFSCGGKQEPNTVDIDEIMGETGVQDIDSSKVDSEEPSEKLPTIARLADKMLIAYDTANLSDFHPMDRFGFSTCRKLKFVGKEQVPYGKKQMVTPVADFFYYSFADSNKTISAFYNYLDIMAEESEGGLVKLNQDIEAIKSPPMFMLVYDTIIVTSRYLCEHEKNNWNAFQDSIVMVYGKEFKYQIDVDCGGPLRWKH